MTAEKSIALLTEEQLEQFENARQAVAADDDLDDLDEWHGEPTDGEIVRELARRYTGDYSLNGDGNGDGGS